MDSIELSAPAKINLALDVIGKRSDGYHDVNMLMQTISLHDTVFIETCKSGIEVYSNNPLVPSDSGNIAFKAAKLFIDTFGIAKGVRITIDKKIPIAAGLAGGSSDAAAVLKGMNKLFSLGLSTEELEIVGKRLGADVPYCIKGGTMLAQGIGEILTPIGPLPRLELVLVKPYIEVSTKWVYENLQPESVFERPNIDMLVQAIEQKNMFLLASNMANVLEAVTIRKHSIISEIKKDLVDAGALGSIMSGSGPSVFGIFSDKPSAKTAFEVMNNGKWDVFLTYTISD